MFWIKRFKRIAELNRTSNRLVDEANACLETAAKCNELATLYLDTLPGVDEVKEEYDPPRHPRGDVLT